MTGRARFCGIQRVFATVLTMVLLAAVAAGCVGFALGTPAEPVELTFVFMEEIANYEPLAQAFHEQHPNITIKLDPISRGQNASREFELKIEDADAVRISSMSIPDEFVETFLPFDSFISTNSEFSEEDLFPGVMDGLKVDGKQLGLPAGINPFVIYYSPVKFKAAGVEVPRPNWTLEEFVATAAALNYHEESQMGSERYAYGFCTHPQFSDLALLTYLFGGRLFDSMVQISRPTLNERANIEALTWYANLKNELDLVPDTPTPRRVGELVYRNGCGLWIDWLDKSSYGPGAGIDSQPLPLPRGSADFNIATLDGYFVLKTSEHPEEAFLWANFLMRQQEASGQLIPPVKKAIATADYAARAPLGTVNVARSLPEQTVILSVDMFRDRRFGAVLEAFSEASVKVIDGEMDAQSALDAAQSQAEAAFR